MLNQFKERRTIREFQPVEVERQKIEQLLEAAIHAPNDRMREPWHFYVLQEDALGQYRALAREFLEQRFPTKPNLVEGSMKSIEATPLIIVVTSKIAADDEGATYDNLFAVSSAIMSMWLMGESLDLGMVWRTRGVGFVHEGPLHEFIGANEDERLVGTLCIGYPVKRDLPEKKRTSYIDKTTWV
ncbi:nitroreductase [Bacillus ectoiniformans]|uniref:nitroreductase family protein n=1 Tax=Bacillus ectoiniformans TaxID=1494429 RepID=UPI00195D7739|nr:nitroreductase [Bacillus ectoiniformans]MBM7647819.1 nitroreductase [Bacillus ectoiniformans]